MIDDMADDALPPDVREALRGLDPVPPEVSLAARSSLAWRRMDAGLVELLHDSALDPVPGGTRSGTAARAMTFESPEGAALELEVTETGDHRVLMGQLVPPASTHLDIRQPAGGTTAVSDEFGQFRAEGVAAGPLSIRWRLPDGRSVETGWVVV